ncbi:MAG: hypothetical protein LBD82_08110, partial [Deltaproteobacteria bacterium]|nr:hypothetical protein [Deltaproteobacteria bacterium]
MQFFPGAIADLFSAGGRNLPGKNAVFSPKNGFYGSNGIKEALPVFGEIFNNLAEFNEANTPGPSLSFRSVREDRSRIKSADLGLLKEKLAEKGVAEPALDRFMEQLGALFYAPTVGNMLGTAQKLVERQSPPLNEQETLVFSSLLSRMGFDPKAVELMQEAAFAGDGKKILQSIREALAKHPDKLAGQKDYAPASFKAVASAPQGDHPSTLPVRPYHVETVQEPGVRQARILATAFAPASTSVPAASHARQTTRKHQGVAPSSVPVPDTSPAPQAAGKNRDFIPDASGKSTAASFNLSKEEAALLCRAADLSAESEQKIMQAFGSEKTELPLDRDLFSQVFGPALGEKTRLQTENIRLNEALPTAIRDMFAHKMPEQILPSGDNKSSRRAEHTQIMAREKATSLNEETEKGKNIRHDAPVSRRRSIALHLKGGAEEPPPATLKPSGRNASEAPRPLVQVQPQLQPQSQNQLQAQTHVQLQLQQAQTSLAHGSGRTEQAARPAPVETIVQAVPTQILKHAEANEKEKFAPILTEGQEKDVFKPMSGPAEGRPRGKEDQEHLGRSPHKDEAPELYAARLASKGQSNTAIE